MKILVYFNVVNKNFNVILGNDFLKKVGDTYKTNSILVAIIDTEKSNKPLKIIRKNLISFKYKIGRLFINFGNYLQGRKNPKITYRETKNFSWWK